MQRDRPEESFAVQLLEEYRSGKSIEQLSREMGIPPERIEMRLKAAATYLRRHSEKSGPTTLLGMRRKALHQ